MSRQRRLFDWRLVASIAFLSLVAYAIWSGFDAASTLKQHDRAAAADRHAAAIDRRTTTENQRALLDYTAALAARQDALLGYLRAHGIHLPQRLVTVVPPPRIVVRHHRAHRSGGRTRHRHSSTSSGAKQPGKSGGHRKHPRRRH